jgi:tRNA modification GTPase
VWVADATAPLPPPADLAASEDRLVRIANKVDLCPRGAAPDAAHGLAVSAVTGAGIGTLIERLAGMARQRIGSLEHPAITAVRHRIHLETCLRALRSFLAGSELQAELRAEDLRQAANALGRLTGRIDAEQVLDHIFSRFCIGK